MEVQLAVLADGANVAAGGKLNILGVFDTIYASGFPTLHPFMALALRLRIEYEDGGRAHELVISLQDEDGREHARAAGRLEIPAIPAGVVQHVDQVLNFAGMVFTRAGHFAFHVSIDGQPKTRVELNIQHGTGPAA